MQKKSPSAKGAKRKTIMEFKQRGNNNDFLYRLKSDKTDAKQNGPTSTYIRTTKAKATFTYAW